MRFVPVLCLVALSRCLGCMGPVALHKAVLGCDESLSRIEREILEFLAAGIDRNPEYDMEADPRTGEVAQNPTKTMDIQVTERRLSEAFLDLGFKGKHYAIPDRPWDRQAFALLYNLYQMTVTDVTGVGAPVITISK